MDTPDMDSPDMDSPDMDSPDMDTTPKARCFDWPALMSLGLHNLNLSPQEFWRLTPYELRIKLGAMPNNRQTLGRAQFESLCARFPDE